MNQLSQQAQGRAVASGAPRLARRAFLALAIALLAALWLGMLHSPEPNWDEGWTLSLARTWVERGVYGQLLMGEPRSPELAASFLTVAPVAAAFKLLGVGFWQGRMATALLTLASLAALAALARRVYGSLVGAAVVPVLLLTTILSTGNPLYLGREAMGESMMLLCLILAYLALSLALAGPWPWALAAMVFGGLALIAKAQPLPFLTASLLAPLPLLLWRRRWRMIGVLLATLAGALLAARLIVAGWALVMAGRLLPAETVVGVASSVALVTAPNSRMFALEFSALIAVPALLGMAWAAWRLLRGVARNACDDPIYVIRLVLLSFVGCWYAWFLLLAVGWERYLYPVVFIGSIFTTAMLAEWTGGFRPREVLARLRAGGWPGRAALVATALLAVCAPASLFLLAYSYPITSDRGLINTATWLNSHTPPGAVIETNESPLFVYVDRPYHFPPYQLHVVSNQRLILEEDVPYNYDPLQADPDYLVVGYQGLRWGIYEPTIAAGQFRKVETYGYYTIYARVRP
jgi:hypothetical protein